MSDLRQTIETVWQIESARLIARLTRIVRDVALAEDLASDALEQALETWPGTGVPEKPGAWLLTTARHRALDVLRRGKMRERHHEVLARELEARELSAPAEPDDVPDDLLRLMFMTCHPALSTEARVALTLRLLGGLTTDEIARAFLTPEPTVAQRIVRAKKTLTEHRAGFDEVLDREERLDAVLEVLYLIFNEGYSATAGEHWLRPALCEEAMRLGRILAELAPAEAAVHGLVALMELQASRLRARVGPDGEPILLADQNRASWDHTLIRHGLAALARAHGEPHPYVIQAEIAACHARARSTAETDWERIAALYATLNELGPSPVLELNRAVAVGMARGPAAALPLVDALQGEPALARYHLLPSVRGDLLFKLGRRAEARAEFERAARLTRNERERALLEKRARDCV